MGDFGSLNAVVRMKNDAGVGGYALFVLRVMGIRRKTLTDKLIHWLMMLPWWVALGVGVAGYSIIEGLQRETFGGKGSLGMALGTGLYAPLWLGFFVCVSVMSAVHRRDRERSVDVQSGLESLKAMDWKAFERLVAEAFGRQGYRFSYDLESGPDGGVDVKLRKDGRVTVVQCKKWKLATVGVAVVREMFGVMHACGADAVMVVTTGGFSPDALAFAKGKPITLIDGQALWKLVREVQRGAVDEDGVVAAPPPMVADAAGKKPEAEGVMGVAPCCPRCGGRMVKKEARKGRTPGAWFWGCARYPECRGSVSI